jgi:superoxide reductase
MKNLYQDADWKTEKHVPVIEAPDVVKKGESFQVRVVVGKEVNHPNTTAHHISWVELWFKPEGEKFPYQITKADFSAHGASPSGADTSSVYTSSDVIVNMKTEKAGTLYSSSFCNVHGLWSDEKTISVE